MGNNGWRKPTPGLVVAEKHGQAGERLAVPKSQAIVALKKVATAIGLRPSDITLIDTLSAFTQPQDWETGRRPIVWASNGYLMDQTGFSLTALKRHLRKLAECGLICFRDSSNGKRWGHRDDEGYIVEAYGLDLSPLAARAGEFEALHAQIVDERALCKALRNTITISRRMIRAKIEKALQNALRGPWGELAHEFALLLSKLPGRSVSSDMLMDIVDWFKELQVRVEKTFEAAFDWPEQSDEKDYSEIKNSASFSQKTDPKEAINGPHILITNQPNPVKSNIHENMDQPDSEAQLDLSANEEPSDDLELDIQWSTHGKSGKSELDVATLMLTCPHFAEMARGLLGYLHNWQDVHRAADQVRPMAGISEDAWTVAQKALGPAVASAAIALVFDKYSAGEVQSPGGYLRGIVEKARAGELHLERSFYGRLSERRMI